ncbi:MAG: response regulator [Candidatus Nealsonbacteria bacterium]
MVKKILIIEDESALQKTLGDFLEEKGYEVISALDGELGLALAKEKIPDLILLDLILPKINGFDVLKELKEDEKTKSIPVIVLTNLEGIGDVEKVIGLGATTYLVKTEYKLEEVLSKIKQTLNE